VRPIMFDLTQILTPECTLVDVQAGSKKKLLETASELLAEHYVTLQADELLDALMVRERLGSTALGHGVAIPHCRLPGPSMAIGALLRLATPIDFDAPDDAPIDIAFVLVVPAEARDDHLEILSHLARGFSEEACRKRLRAAPDGWGMYQAALEVFSPPADTGT